jgi:hypothetical protein
MFEMSARLELSPLSGPQIKEIASCASSGVNGDANQIPIYDVGCLKVAGRSIGGDGAVLRTIRGKSHIAWTDE